MNVIESYYWRFYRRINEHLPNNNYYGGNRIINMIISPFGYRTCRHFGHRWSHGRKRCWCIISKKYKLPFRYEDSVGRYCHPCGLSMDELKEEDYRDEAEADARADWCELHPEDCEELK
tara:strand:- start:614 stop:970 length:357 start_codon:yes stop_codon:yes gene_type:complete